MEENKREVSGQELKDTVKEVRVMADFKDYKRLNSRGLLIIAISAIAAVVIMAGVMVYGTFNAQRMMNEAVLNALNTVAEIGITAETTTTTTTTQTGEGDNVEFNNVSGDQYTDSATNEGAGE